jgi:hypothetical protein
MKKQIFLTVIIGFLATISYSQNYYFKQKDEFIQYTNSKGEFTTKLEKTTYGNYKMVFEMGNLNGKKIPLFTEYIENVDMGYYALLEQKRSQEQKGKIYEVYIYYSTETEGEVRVLFSTDKTSLVIFKNGKITEYKK